MLASTVICLFKSRFYGGQKGAEEMRTSFLLSIHPFYYTVDGREESDGNIHGGKRKDGDEKDNLRA